LSDSIHIWPEKQERVLDCVSCSATLEFPGGLREKLWYKIPLEWQNSLTEKADPYLIATIFSGMANKTAIYVHGEVSETLLENLEEFQAVWQCWKPEQYKMVSLFADHEIKSRHPSTDNAIISFSGGVDSCFSAYRHANKLCGRQNKKIKAGVMVHGFDIPLSKGEDFSKALTRSTNIFADIGVPLIAVQTNWKEIQQNLYSSGVAWEDSHGSAVISVISLFQNDFAYGLLATGDIGYKKIIWGSNPLSDPMLSSDELKIIPDGGSFTRVSKVSLIANWEAASRNLRVCWEGPDLSKNCGVCEKCIRTILDYRVVCGRLPPCFDKDVSNKEILSIPIHSSNIAANYQSIVDLAIYKGMKNESWVRALEKRLEGFYHPPLVDQINKFRRLSHASRKLK
jgi:hypothetical protein